jgi:hypothetical protein
MQDEKYETEARISFRREGAEGRDEETRLVYGQGRFCPYPAQQTAILSALLCRLTLVIGPPGTSPQPTGARAQLFPSAFFMCTAQLTLLAGTGKTETTAAILNMLYRCASLAPGTFSHQLLSGCPCSD